MKKLCHLSNNILIVSILLIVFFPTGAFSHCGNNFHAHVHTVKEIDALIGSCVDISCRFENFEGFDSRRITFGIWMKNKAEVSDTVYNSSGKINTYQMETTGNLRRQNCSIRIPNLTAAHADKYFFRLENEPVKVTFCDDPFKLTVRDSAWSPIINVSGSELKEHQSVTVTCSAHTPCSLSPPILSWNIEGDSVRKIEKITDGAFTTKFQETITLYDTHNGYSIKCSAKYPVTGGFKQAVAEKTLNVSCK
ncbi:myeloid cell surface antigen CD33-like [Poecilia reticulata]|uniref:myeloid cell surface antigen CD33-like n=1 Tax=Poecilia reticulata TaxID=8081 RepID=UPI0004A42DB8|nr:PREDICTED: myeloid cell surface antigen CD33-like [Poecilia reticulata]XP_008436890.1 PREDICTED: myeloid cell surface antigen CD33-like [Poecilia reticulata]XP_017157438.1 PREDICTED: myeloid cell surface antigen CD33-like [Poecilia reticulata]